MARPKKIKRLSSIIGCNDFVPVTSICLETIYLEREEFEAINLKDFQGLEQKQASKKMAISQPTFHRVLLNARKKIADALINKKEIKIK
jgi:uncharacterized protein